MKNFTARQIWLATLWVLAIALFLGALAHPGHASAAPWDDPHHPDIGTMSCAGGGVNLLAGNAACNGTPYADGSFWHQGTYRAFGTLRITTFCVVSGEGIWHPRAPQGEGFCGGEW